MLEDPSLQITQVFKSGPETSSSEHGERRVALQHFSQEADGKYRFQILSENGDSILETEAYSDVDWRTLEVLKISANPGRRSKSLISSTTILSKSSYSDGDASTVSSMNNVQLCVKILVPDARDLSGSIGLGREDIFRVCAPEIPLAIAESWSPRNFYDCVHVPNRMSSLQDLPAVDQLQCKLYPFQRRAVQWLLHREGVSQDGQPKSELLHGFEQTKDADGRECFASPLLGMITSDKNMLRLVGTDPKGGILAEEMGLGKTVEMIALIRGNPSTSVEVPGSLPPSPATLIITPPAILQQWKTELRSHDQSLKVFIYEGLRVEAARSNEAQLLNKCRTHDVVLTTYSILAKEIHHADDTTPKLNLRHEKKYVKRLTPLTQMMWWRVVLDEAQMVENGVSNAAKVAKLIPRKLSWCVSGTPVKKDARDLLGLLQFLQCKPYCDLSPQIWDRLVTHHRNVFKDIFGTLALRRTKEQIKDEIQLPPQKRVVITVPFTPIEEQHYSTLFKEMSDECGLDVDGAPLTDDWDPESSLMIERMRSWLTRLRQTCLHPEVGARNRRALGNGKGPLRTVEEVLEVMIDQNETAARSEERTLLLSQLRRGQILEHAELSMEALGIWLEALEQAKAMVLDCRDQLSAEIDRLSDDPVLIGEDVEAATDIRTGPHRQRLRAAIECEHMATFFIANAYYQIKTDDARTDPQSDDFKELERKEESTYERAKILRKELLQEARKKADSVTEKIKQRPAVVIPRMPPSEYESG